MKINKIYISAFGGLKDFILEFDDGLNVIYGNNEDGKSTVAAFIRTMFYGTGRNSKNLTESTRQKYTPWDGSVMAGRVFFEHNGKRYCLEREFRKSDSTDRITLTDTDSGKEINTSENIGKQFFGISDAAFERSLFIGNGDFIKNDTAAGEINGKLSNIAFTGNEDVSYKKIEKNIFDARAKLISKSGKSGSYNADLQMLDTLNSRLEKADRDAKTKAQLSGTAASRRKEYEALYKKYTELKTLIDREQDFKNREKLSGFLFTKRRLDELNATLTLDDGTIINENFAQKVDFALAKYQTASDRCEQISHDIENINKTVNFNAEISPENAQAQIDALTSDADRLSRQKLKYEADETELTAEINALKQKAEAVQNKRKNFNPLFLSLFAALALLGSITVFALSVAVGLGLCAVSLILLVLAFAIKPKNSSALAATQNQLAAANNKLAEKKSEKNLIVEQINDINAHINKLSSVLHADAALGQQRNQMTEALTTEQQKAKTAKVELLSLLSGFDDIDNVEKAKSLLVDIKQKTATQKEIKLQLKTASQFLGNIDYADAEAKLEALKNDTDRENIDFDLVKSEFEKTAEDLSALKEELTVIATELKTSFKNSENPEDLRREIKQLNEKITSKKSFCDAADLAISVLEESFYELRRGYGSELEKTTHGIFTRLTDGKYNCVNITDVLDMSVEQSGVFGTHELGYLSLGTTHQAYLSLRLAIAELIGGENRLPIFLDDSLSQYDDERTKRAITFLKEFCQNGQGIMFTCHNAICEIAKSQGITVKNPYR